MVHQPVLLNEILNELELEPGDVFIDGTLGGGGHSLAVCQKFKAEIIGFELDPKARQIAAEKLKGCSIKIIPENFKNISKVKKKAKAILFDLGLSSILLEHSGRGFSFLKDEPLLMTFGEPKNYLYTAADIVNNWQEKNLYEIIKGYGEERYAAKIAKAIIQNRPIKTTFDLVAVIAKAVPQSYKRRKIHFATKTFQALRIAVNDELNTLKEALPKAYDLLMPGGKLFVISFHSLEDRIVKNFFKEKKKEVITKKPIRPTQEEIKINPRARSAKLRILKKHD